MTQTLDCWALGVARCGTCSDLWLTLAVLLLLTSGRSRWRSQLAIAILADSSLLATLATLAQLLIKCAQLTRDSLSSRCPLGCSPEPRARCARRSPLAHARFAPLLNGLIFLAPGDPGACSAAFTPRLNPPAAPASGAGDPKRGAAVVLPAPNWNVPLEPALPLLLAEPNEKPPVGVEGWDGCEGAPKLKLGVDAGAAPVVELVEPKPDPEPKPPPLPKPVLVLGVVEPAPKPGPEPKPLPLAGVEALFVLPKPEPAPKVNEPLPLGVDEDAAGAPKPLVPALFEAVLDEPKLNEGVEGAAALLVEPNVFEVVLPNVLLGVVVEPNEKPDEAGAAPAAGVGVDGVPKLNGLSPPFTDGVLVAGAVDVEPKLNGFAGSAGLAALLEPNEKPLDAGADAAGAGLADVDPKLKAGLSVVVALDPLAEPKPPEAGAAELEPKLNEGASFFSSGFEAPAAGVEEPNENDCLSAAAGVVEPKVLPPAGAADDEPKLNAGLSAAGLSVDGAGVDEAEPNEKAGFSAAGLSVEAAGAPKLNAGLSAAAGVEGAGVELPEPKLKGALGASAGLSAAGAGVAEGVPKLKAGLEASAGLSAAGVEVLPKEKPEVFGASAGLSVDAAGAPKLKAGLDASAGLSAAGVVEDEPKLKGALGASVDLEASLLLDPLNRLLTTGGPVSAGLMPKSSLGGGVEAPDAGFEPPKKLGTPPSAGLGVVSATGVVVPVAGFEKKLLAGGLPAGVVEPVGVSEVLLAPEAAPDREKKPVCGGGDFGVELIGAGAESFFGVVSGLEASATIELFARGDEARGRDDRPLRRFPSELSWAFRC